MTNPSVVVESPPVPEGAQYTEETFRPIGPDSGTSAEVLIEDDAPLIESEEAHDVYGYHPRFFGLLRRWWLYRAKPHLQATHWGYPEYFHERPFGTLVREHLQRQALNGVTDQLVLYRYDFSDGPGMAAAQLNARGRDQVRKLANMSKETGHPITIERTRDNARMDRARRQAVLRELERQGVAASPEMVVVGTPRAFGMGGDDAIRIYANRMDQTQTQGSGSQGVTASDSAESGSESAGAEGGD